MLIRCIILFKDLDELRVRVFPAIYEYIARHNVDDDIRPTNNLYDIMTGVVIPNY